MVRAEGIEPTRIAPLEPKSSASANFATLALPGQTGQIALLGAVCRRDVFITRALYAAELPRSRLFVHKAARQSKGLAAVAT